MILRQALNPPIFSLVDWPRCSLLSNFESLDCKRSA
eukprot:COSAG01_NODE_397_length_17560_cov_111.258347_4_plen_36_part_00